MKDFPNFTLLKKYLLIFFILTGLNFTSFAQNRSTTTGDQQPKFLKFYPNPANSVINFEFQRGYDKALVLQIYNFMGKKVQEITNLNLRTTVYLNGFYRGFYNYRLLDKNNQVLESGRFMVVK